MWSITSYYNPVRYKRRLANYKTFRENLATPLVTVELSFDGHFELAEGDADILIQISGGAVLTQKERLLNLALKSVPPNENNIAWLDCEVIFERSDWVDAANEKLNEFAVIQLFSDLVDLSRENLQLPSDCHAAPPTGQGIVTLVSERHFDVASLLRKEYTRSKNHLAASIAQGQVPSNEKGLAWAARREILENHELYDAMIVGGGVVALAAAMYGEFETLIDGQQLNSARQEHYLKWARPYHQAVGGRIGHVPGRVYHLWHGDPENRRYVERTRWFADFAFDPDADLVIGANGAWQWARSRPDLEQFFTNYFLNRADDG
jgi:hypothetical protein